MAEQDLTDEQYILLIYFMLRQSASEKASQLWQGFENEIRYKSRFFPKGELLTKVETLQNQAELQIKSGERFYRARLFKDHFLGYYPKETLI